MEASQAVREAAPEIPSLEQWTRERILEWCRACGNFLRWESEHLLHQNPSAKDREDHKLALTWMLRLTKLYYAAVSDPEFPHPALLKEVRGRLRQLEDSWQMFYNRTLTEAEAEKVLAEIFPDERRA